MTQRVDRVDWDSYFMTLAEHVSTRATCDRKHVGAVIVKNNNILATGYNGSISGLEHCDDAGHDMVEGHCVRTIHAEVNAVTQAAKNGTAIDGATVYVNTFPCWSCFKVLVNAGIKKVYYLDAYRVDERVVSAAGELGIPLVGMQL